MTQRSPEQVTNLLRSKNVVSFEQICEALGQASASTAFRYLKQVQYRRSYNHNGRWYTLHRPTRYDDNGLFSVGDIHFSKYGSLKSTIQHLIHEAPGGQTQRELEGLLRVRIGVLLLDLFRKEQVARERVVGSYVYLHMDPSVRRGQLQQRGQQHAAELQARTNPDVFTDVHTVIEILLVLIRHQGAQARDVVRRLRGHEPPVAIEQVEAVFTRYDLGEKRGS